MRTAIALAALMIAILSPGCSDDADSKQDSGITSDSAPRQDSNLTSDSGDLAVADSSAPALMDIGLILLDSGDEPWNCAQIAQCQKECGSDTNCLGACSSRGCSSAKDAIAALTQCAIQKCIASCVGGFNDACNACTSTQCPDIYAACTSNTCEG